MHPDSSYANCLLLNREGFPRSLSSPHFSAGSRARMYVATTVWSTFVVRRTDSVSRATAHRGQSAEEIHPCGDYFTRASYRRHSRLLAFALTASCRRLWTDLIRSRTANPLP